MVKEKWPGYVLQVIKSAVSDSKRPRLGLIVVDEEKALPAYLLGYGVEFKNEIYSGLSKRMSQKDFTEQQNKYYEKVLSIVGGHERRHGGDGRARLREGRHKEVRRGQGDNIRSWASGWSSRPQATRRDPGYTS